MQESYREGVASHPAVGRERYAFVWKLLWTSSPVPDPQK